MAKMFYTLEEVSQRLGKSEDEVREMAGSGQIQEFRDRDKLMFKVEQIDLLAGDEDTGDVHLDLEDTSGGSGLELSGSGIPLADTREGTGTGTGTGISVFDTDHGGEDDTEKTAVGASAATDDELSLEAVGSGSGLLDLTRESDDTSLGAELLEEVYSGDENIDIHANASGMFEADTAESTPEEVVSTAGIAAMPRVVEAYDGVGSGLGVGMLIGAIIALICVAITVIVGINGATPDLAMKFAGGLWMWAGALLGITIVCGLVGMFIGKASE